MTVGRYAEKINIVCNDHRRTGKLQFFYVRTELPFLSKFGPKIKIVSLRRNLVGRLIRICKFNGDAQFFRFRPEIPFLGKFGPKNQTYQFKIGTKTNLNMQNSMVMFFSVIDWKYPFWANLVQKIKFVNLSWNLADRLIRICRNKC